MIYPINYFDAEDLLQNELIIVQSGTCSLRSKHLIIGTVGSTYPNVCTVDAIRNGCC